MHNRGQRLGKQKKCPKFGTLFCRLRKPLFLLGGFLLGKKIAAGFEFGNFLGGNLNGLASLRVLGGAGFALDDTEGTEADQGHFLAFVQFLLNAVEAGIHGSLRGNFRHAGLGGDGVDKFGFVHFV